MIRGQVVAGWYALAVLGISVCATVVWGLDGAGGPLVATGFAALAMFAPLAATVVVERFAPRDGELGWRPRASWWLVVASGLGLALPLLALGVGALLPGVAWDWQMSGMLEQLGTTLTADQLAEVRAQIEAMPVHPLFLTLPQAVIAGATINALFAFGEEIGWRGWLYRELRPLGLWRASLVTGVLWGLWHAPLILLTGHNYPTQRVAGVFLFVLVCIGLSPLHAFIRDAGRTVWAAAILHGTVNAAAGLSILVVVGGELVVGVQGLAGVLALALANGGLALWLQRQPRSMIP